MNHKFNYFYFIIYFIPALLLGQSVEENKLIEYPFGEPGSDVSRGIIGKDDRKEITDARGYEDFARATASMINKNSIYNNEFYSWSLRERLMRQFGTKRFHKNVKFLDQPALSSCTGFLIAPDILVTAGHCISSLDDAKNFVWVFDYTNDLDFINDRRLRFEDSNIFEVKGIIDRKLDDESNDDYLILRLNRKSKRKPYRFRTSGKVLLDSKINTIGSPSGLPLKLADNAKVIKNDSKNSFSSNIDSFPGNSGGPVFNPYGFLEGIHVRGLGFIQNGKVTSDYYFDSSCYCIKTVHWESADNSVGVEAHKITAIPTWILKMAIYENIEYAINKGLHDRLDSWSTYKWIFNDNYTISRGRFETLAIKNNNYHALVRILQQTSEKMTDDYARRLIDLTIKQNDLKALQIILESGILADSGMNSKYTPLQIAVLNNDLNLAQLLIKFGAYTKVISSSGNNLLHLAAMKGNREIIPFLLEQGISLKDKNSRGKRPEKIAKKNGFKSLSRYLKNTRKSNRY